MKMMELTKYASIATLLIASTASAQADVPRTPSGKPDLSGTYNTATLTPLERPEFLGDVGSLYPWAASLLNWAIGVALDWTQENTSDPERGAPPKGGDGVNVAGAGGVGGYNAFYIDMGSEITQAEGVVRTSIVYEPSNGRRPATLPGVSGRMGDIYQSFIHENTGTATWLEQPGPGPFDGPESLAPSERCLISFAATVPTIPSLYNNYKRIVQTDTHVMILQEMVHDARIIRIDSEHGPRSNRTWLGDSIAYWDGDVLVVETKNFRKVNGLAGADENLHVTERFSRLDDGNLSTISPSMTRQFGRRNGAVNTSGKASHTARFTNTHAMRAITPWGIFCVELDCWRVSGRLRRTLAVQAATAQTRQPAFKQCSTKS